MSDPKYRSPWPWQVTSTVATDPTAGVLRRGALFQGAVMIAIAALLRFGIGHVVFAAIVAGLALSILLIGLAAPFAYAPLHRFGGRLGHGVGMILTYLLLVPFHLLVFAPVGLYLKLAGRDPLHRRERPAGLSYWIRRGGETPAADFHRQFLRENRSARAERRPLDTDDGGREA